MSERADLASGASLAALIGKRVTIRLKDGDGLRDIVGVLESQTSLINRHGEKIDFSHEKIALWREIIPLPDKAGSGAPFSIRIMELELLSNKTWPAPVTLERGGWLYRSANGVSFRANSVLPRGKAPNGEPIQNVDEEIKFCIEYYKSLGQNPTIAVPLPIFQELDSKLESLGWESEISAHFLIRDIPLEKNVNTQENNFVVTSAPTPEWIAVQADQDIEEIMKAYPASYVPLHLPTEQNLPDEI